MSQITTVSEARCFGGLQGFYSHESEACQGTMRFAVFQPPQALNGDKVPVLTYLSGLTCTEENFVIKAGAQRLASELGLMVVAPDTSPRGAGVPGEDDDYDLGTAAGFYVDATEAPWSRRPWPGCWGLACGDLLYSMRWAQPLMPWRSCCQAIGHMT